MEKRVIFFSLFALVAFQIFTRSAQAQTLVKQEDTNKAVPTYFVVIAPKATTKNMSVIDVDAIKTSVFGSNFSYTWHFNSKNGNGYYTADAKENSLVIDTSAELGLTVYGKNSEGLGYRFFPSDNYSPYVSLIPGSYNITITYRTALEASRVSQIDPDVDASASDIGFTLLLDPFLEYDKFQQNFDKPGYLTFRSRLIMPGKKPKLGEYTLTEAAIYKKYWNNQYDSRMYASISVVQLIINIIENERKDLIPLLKQDVGTGLEISNLFNGTLTCSAKSHMVITVEPVEQFTMVEDIPNVMDNMQWSTASHLMRLWMNRPIKYSNDNPAIDKLDLSLPVLVRDISLSWLLDAKHNKNNDGQLDRTYQDAFQKTYSSDILITPEHYREILKLNPQIDALKKGQICAFGTYQPSQFTGNPIGFYHKYTTQRSGPTLHASSTTLTEAFASIGDTTFWIAPKGIAKRLTNGEIKITITQIGVYFIDSYDFNGHYPLGLWKKPSSVGWPQLENATLIKQFDKDFDLAQAELSNFVYKDSFERYRRVTKNGGDFLIIPDKIRMITLTSPISFTYSDAILRQTIKLTPVHSVP